MKKKLTIHLNKKEKLLEKYQLLVSVETEKPMIYNLHFRWMPKTGRFSDFNKYEEKFLIENTTKFIEQRLTQFLKYYINSKIN